MAGSHPVRTLSSWRHLLRPLPITLDCPRIALVGRDAEGPLIEGTGRIVIESFTRISYRMFAAVSSTAFERLVHLQRNPYDADSRMRFVATDGAGIEWTGGYTDAQLGLTTGKLFSELHGALDTLSTDVSGLDVSSDSSVELVVQPPVWLPMDQAMETTITLGGVEIEYRRLPARKTLRLLGTEIEFFHTPEKDSLWIVAKTADALPHPHAENWLTEPLRILMGQLIYPRLVARNFGNGTAHIWLRPSPPHLLDSAIASLVDGDPFKPGFWNLYGKLLEHIAALRDEDGLRQFEASPLARLYHEVIGATQGSRWALCLTLAGTAEALARMLMGPAPLKSDYAETDISSLRDHVGQWKGDGELKSRILGRVSEAGTRTVGKFLRDLQARGVLTAANVEAWSTLRNTVMHGNLLSPYSDEENDNRILSLADMVHRLTRAIIGADMPA